MSHIGSFRQNKPGTASAYSQLPAKSGKAHVHSLTPHNVLETAGTSASAEEAVEVVLKYFDLDSRYGPCAEMTRLERWERAQLLGLNPPQDVKHLVEAKGRGSSRDMCIWAGRL